MPGKRKQPTAAQLAAEDLLIEAELSMRPALAAAPELVEALLEAKRRRRPRKKAKQPSAAKARKSPGKKKARKAAGKK
jgi:hypothetical protein